LFSPQLIVLVVLLDEDDVPEPLVPELDEDDDGPELDEDDDGPELDEDDDEPWPFGGVCEQGVGVHGAALMGSVAVRPSASWKMSVDAGRSRDVEYT
jgi:hypothetical protein